MKCLGLWLIQDISYLSLKNLLCRKVTATAKKYGEDNLIMVNGYIKISIYKFLCKYSYKSVKIINQYNITI